MEVLVKRKIFCSDCPARSLQAKLLPLSTDYNNVHDGKLRDQRHPDRHN